MSERTEIDAALEHAKDPVVLQVEDGFGRTQVLAVPDGWSIESARQHLDETLERPRRRKGVAALQTLESFIAHTKRFAGPSSALFAVESPPALWSVIDYHAAGFESPASFGCHRATYKFSLSDEWGAWQSMNEVTMTQKEFAEFIEDRITDIADPSHAKDSAALRELLELLGTQFATPSRLLELSRGLSVRQNNRVKQSQNLATGEASIVFETSLESEAGEALKVPGAFLIGVPVFKHGAMYRLAARLRFRVTNGSIGWSYKLHNASRALEHAFLEACDMATKETGLPLFFGHPEVG